MCRKIQTKQNPSLDDLVTLRARVQNGTDSIGNPIVSNLDTEVWCADTPASQSEFYQAAQQHIRPEYVLVVNSDEYNGEEVAIFYGTQLTIYRNYARPDGFTELYCKREVSDIGKQN